MKIKSFIIIAFAGLLSLVSCKKDETKVILNKVNPSIIAAPVTTDYTLLKVNEDSTLFTITWDASTYELSNSAPQTHTITYTLEIDTTGNNFKNIKSVTSTTDLSYTTSVKAWNTYLISILKLTAGTKATYDFRIRTSLTEATTKEDVFSNTITLSFIPYSTEIILPPIYLLGSATSVGWDNNAALPMTHIGMEGIYTIVAHLTSGSDHFIKFIANLGAWAPQWGTDASGTNTSGPLVYRQTEAIPDPSAIPVPATEGDFRIVADTANLTYTISPVTNALYLLGDATTAGWNNATPLPMAKTAPGIFEITTTLTSGGMKFLEIPGQWAPQWGTDATGTSAGGILVYRATESVPDPTNIPSPGAGTYTITVNLATQTYTIVAK